jgi:hypothetical protein
MIIHGSPDDDIISGTSNTDTIFGEAGNDRISSGVRAGSTR